MYENYQYDEAHNLFVDKLTGEALEAEMVLMPAGSIIQTPNDKLQQQINKDLQREQYIIRAENKRNRDIASKHIAQVRNGLGSFVNGSLSGLEVLTPPEVTYLARLSTYLRGYNNGSYIMATERKPMSKDDAQYILDIGRSSFYDFLAHAKQHGFIDEDKNGLRIIKNFWVGSRPKDEQCGWIQIYKERFNRAYETLPKSKRKYLGYVFLGMRYVNFRYFILCKNPDEINFEYIEPMNMRELLQELGIADDQRTAKAVQEIITKTRFGDGDLISSVFTREADGKQFILVNPKLFGKGSWDYIKSDKTASILLRNFD